MNSDYQPLRPFAGGGSEERSLQETPTWAVALVCTVFVIISIIIEHGIHSLGKFFKKRKKKAMNEIKAELMLLGFISLLLTVGTSYIVKIYISTKLGDTFLPYEHQKKKSYKDDGDKGGSTGGGDDRRKLLLYAEKIIWRRALASGDEKEDYCAAKEKVSLISYTGVHQLHIFIFILAVFHVLYSIMLVVLGQAKMMKWKAWEAETSSLEYQYTTDPERFRFSHQTSFMIRHARFSSMPGVKWIWATKTRKCYTMPELDEVRLETLEFIA